MVKFCTSGIRSRCERGAEENLTDDGQYRGAGFFAKSRFWEPPCYYRVKFSRLSSVFFLHARMPCQGTFQFHM